MAPPEWNFGHVAGVCDVGFIGTADAKVVTCGADNAVYVRNPASFEVEEAFTEEHTDMVNVLCVAPDGKKFVTGSDDTYVKLFNFEGSTREFESNVTRFTLPVRALAYSNDGTLLAAGGEDSSVKVIDMKDKSVFLELQTRSKCVKSVAFDPKGEFLSAVDDAGSLTVWALKAITKEGDEEEDKAVVEPGDSVMSATVAPVTTPDSPSTNGAKWRPDGLILAVPGREHDVTFFARNEWTELEDHRLMTPTDTTDDADRTGHTDAVAFVQWSPNGKYLLSSGKDCVVAVWDLSLKKIVTKMTHDAAVCGAQWKQDANEVALVDVNGQWAVWTDVVPKDMTSPFAEIKPEELEFFTGAVGDVADADEKDADSDLTDMDEESYYAEMEKRRVEKRKLAEKAKKEAAAGSAFSAAPTPQPPFQVGAVKGEKVHEKASRRFLCYNMMGTVVVTGEPGTEFASIEMAFHDTSRAGRVPTITDYHGYDTAVLGERGVALASPGNKESAATVFYRPYESWAHAPEWRVTLPKGEKAVSSAAGASWVAAVTSERLLRVFTHAGAQKHIVTLPGAPVTVAGRGDSLLVAFHANAPALVSVKKTLEVEQRLKFVEYDMSSNGRVLAKGALPIPPGQTLTWLGHVEDASAAVVFATSDGVVSVRTSEFGGAFTPVFRSADARSQEGEHHWPVAVSVADDIASQAGLYCVVCRSNNGPQVHPKPVLTPLPLSAPIALPEGSTGELEDLSLKSSIAVALAAGAAEKETSRGEDGIACDALRQAQAFADKASLRLFHAACKAERPARAADVAASLHLQSSMHGALKLANALSQPALAQRVTSLIEASMAQALAEQAAKMTNTYYEQPSALETPGQGPSVRETESQKVTADDANPFARRTSLGAKPAPKDENDPAEETNHLKQKAGFEADVKPAKKARAANPFARK